MGLHTPIPDNIMPQSTCNALVAPTPCLLVLPCFPVQVLLCEGSQGGVGTVDVAAAATTTTGLGQAGAADTNSQIRTDNNTLN